MSELEIARVAGVHGVRGAVKVVLHWAQSEGLASGREVKLRLDSGAEERYRIESMQRAGRSLLVKFSGIDDRDGARRLGGARVFVERAELPPLAEGEVYLVDLVGAEVRGPDGPIGVVVEVVVHPTADTVVIRREDGKTVEQPLTAPFLARIDAAKRTIELNTLDGLIE